jgi:hypothetical protein
LVAGAGRNRPRRIANIGWRCGGDDDDDDGDDDDGDDDATAVVARGGKSAKGNANHLTVMMMTATVWLEPFSAARPTTAGASPTYPDTPSAASTTAAAAVGDDDDDHDE